ncbi:MAG TPA: hypothetical protein VMW66_03245 [Elusimicrobiales bacterium]|nr:hypothetical protein [Elusimicrobiales bacterium]
MLTVADTILIPTHSNPIRHLWIILAKAKQNPEEAIIVNITTQRSDSDKTTILKPSEHPFIKHTSNVNFADARIANIKHLEKAVRKEIAIKKDPLSANLLNKIQKGLLKSPHTPNKIKKLLIETLKHN